MVTFHLLAIQCYDQSISYPWVLILLWRSLAHAGDFFIHIYGHILLISSYLLWCRCYMVCTWFANLSHEMRKWVNAPETCMILSFMLTNLCFDKRFRNGNKVWNVAFDLNKPKVHMPSIYIDNIRVIPVQHFIFARIVRFFCSGFRIFSTLPSTNKQIHTRDIAVLAAATAVKHINTHTAAHATGFLMFRL